MQPGKTIAALIVAGGSAFALSAQVTFFDERFFGDGDPLNGKAPETTTDSAVWQAGDEWGDDGIHFWPTAGGQAAHLAFTPQPGRVYTASTRVRNSQANAFRFGFLPADPPAGAWSDESNTVTHADALGLAWVQTANSAGPDQQGFLGPGATGEQAWSGDIASPLQYVDLALILDTSTPNWTVQWLVNGNPQGTPAAFADPGNPGIGGLGMSLAIDPTFSGDFVETSYVRLTYTAVPEPTSIALLGVAGFMIVSRRRR